MKNRFLTKEQQQLVVGHIDFAVNLAKSFRGSGISMDDLQQEACLGLCEAALRYVPVVKNPGSEEAGKVVAFRTYAYDWCMKFLLLAVRHSGNILTAGEVEQCAAVAETADAECDDRVVKMLSCLTVMERTVVCYVYGIDSLSESVGTGSVGPVRTISADPVEPKSFKEIAAMMHQQTTRVKQLYRNALEKMKTKEYKE